MKAIQRLTIFAGSTFGVFVLALTWAQAGLTLYTYDSAGRLVASDYGANNTLSYAYDNAGNLVQSAMPSPGLLVSRAANNQILLIWPVSPGGFTLESTPALGPANWQPVNVTPSQIGNFNYVTLNANLVARTFHRLRK